MAFAIGASAPLQAAPVKPKSGDVATKWVRTTPGGGAARPLRARKPFVSKGDSAKQIATTNAKKTVARAAPSRRFDTLDVATRGGSALAFGALATQLASMSIEAFGSGNIIAGTVTTLFAMVLGKASWQVGAATIRNAYTER